MSSIPQVNIDIAGAIGWSNRLKEEINDVRPLISKVDALWEAGPVSGTIEDAYAEKLRGIDEKWIKVIDNTWEGIDAVIQEIIKIAKMLDELREKILKI